jgi:hypothetical protein
MISLNPESSAAERRRYVERGRRLEYFTIFWNSLEALAALIAGFIAGSVALVGFGLYSLIEVTSGALLWPLHQDANTLRRERAEKFTLRIVGSCSLMLSAYIAYDSLDITEARSIAELWLWRARTTQLQLSGAAPPDGWTFEKIIAQAVEGAQSKKVFLPIDHDFPALNKAYSKLSEEEWRTMRSIAQERLYALNWLCRYAADWDSVPTGT